MGEERTIDVFAIWRVQNGLVVVVANSPLDFVRVPRVRGPSGTPPTHAGCRPSRWRWRPAMATILTE